MDERRLYERIPVTLRCRIEHAPFPAGTVNVSLRGLFIATQDLPAINSEILLHVQTNSADTITMKCIATWASTGLSGDGFPRGFGAKIIWMKAADWDRWISFINDLQDTAPAT